MSIRARAIGWGLLCCVAACAGSAERTPQSTPNTASSATTPRVTEPVPEETVAVDSEQARPAQPQAAPASPPAPPPPELPAQVEPGVLTEVPVRADKAALVVHGTATTRRALVYLHGVCGDITAPKSFAAISQHHGTLIALHGDNATCPQAGRTRWGRDLNRIDSRIQRAVATVRAARGGLLDAEPLVITGYSQGAARAQDLAWRFPDRYRRVLLAGVPVPPSPFKLGKAERVAIVGGEKEPRKHMEQGLAELQRAQVAAELFVLPKAGHGQYGPDAERVMGDALTWLLKP